MELPLKDEDLHHCPPVGYDLRNWQRLCMQALFTGLQFPHLSWSDTNQEGNGMLENIEGNRRLERLWLHVHSDQLKGEN